MTDINHARTNAESPIHASLFRLSHGWMLRVVWPEKEAESVVFAGVETREDAIERANHYLHVGLNVAKLGPWADNLVPTILTTKLRRL